METDPRLEAVYLVYEPDGRLYESVGMLARQVRKPDILTIYMTVEDDAPEDDPGTEAIREKIRACALGIDNIRFNDVRRSQFGHGRTRQQAMDESGCEYVMFITQDAVPYDNSLTLELLRALDNPDAACAYARQRAYPDADDVEKLFRAFNYPRKSRSKAAADIGKIGVKAFFNSDVCCMYRHSVFDAVGGFDRELKFNEDSIFAYNALMHGYTVEYVAEAVVWHSHNVDLKKLFARSADIARSQLEHPDIFENVSSAHEGIRFFTKGAGYFIRNMRPLSAVRLFIYCAVRYAGYFKGKHFGSLR